MPGNMHANFCWTSNAWVWINLIKCSAGFEVCCCYGYSQCPTGFNFLMIPCIQGVGWLARGILYANPYILSTLGFWISLSQITCNTPFFASQWGWGIFSDVLIKLQSYADVSLGHGGVTFQCFCLPKAIILNPVLHSAHYFRGEGFFFLFIFF